ESLRSGMRTTELERARPHKNGARTSGSGHSGRAFGPLEQATRGPLRQTAQRTAPAPRRDEHVDFRSPYRHGFLRVAAATLRTVIGDPADNVASVLATARECHDEGVGLVVYPELTLSGYSLEDVLLQDTLLDAADAA